MRKLNAKPLTADAFRKYGTYSRMINPDGERLGPPPVEFYRDLVHVNLGSGIPCASVTRVSPRPMIAEKFEYHTATAEAFMPIDGDVIIHIAPAGKAAAVPYDKIEAFSVPKGNGDDARRCLACSPLCLRRYTGPYSGFPAGTDLRKRLLRGAFPGGRET